MANSTIRMLFESAIPASMTTPISDMTFSVVPHSSRAISTPVMPGRKRQQDDEWIHEGTELRHQDQIKQQY